MATRQKVGFSSNLVLIIVVCVIVAVAIFGYLKSKRTSSSNQVTAISATNESSRVKTLVRAFTDSKGREMFVIDYTDPIDPISNFAFSALYLSSNKDDPLSGVRITESGMATHGDSPYISTNDQIKYLVIEQIGPGDGGDIVVVDESGRIVSSRLEEENQDALGLGTKIKGQYGVSFNSWVGNTNKFILEIGVGDGSEYQATVDAATGKVIGGVTQTKQAQPPPTNQPSPRLVNWSKHSNQSLILLTSPKFLLSY